MADLARRNPQKWRGGLLPYKLGGLFDQGVQWAQDQLAPRPFPSLEQLQAMAAARGPVTPDEVASMAVDLASPFAKVGGLLGHTVWHGSPHKWDVPDISKVGTGEGAQAYGHGFYSADLKEVADQYRNPRPTSRMRAGLAAALARANPTPANVKAIEDIRASGHIYKLDIPDDDIPKYLDWDKPLSEQPELFNAIKSAFPYIGNNGHKSGEWALREIGERIGGLSQKLSNDLEKIGIKGIRYLDGSSRGAGHGTYNYVTFDPSRVKVLERK